MLILGVTGPTGAGKTTALRALEDLGAAVIDCDAVYHDLLRRPGPMLAELRARFGDDVFDEDGNLQRKALGAVVFGNPQDLRDLNAITHRYINAEIDHLLDQARAEGRPAAAVDAIALLESSLRDKCGCTVAVTAPDETRVRRVMARDGISEQYARTRVAAQRPSAFFEENCDYTLCNDGDDPAAFYAQARALFEQIIPKEEF